jgi:hypothetical protein
MFTYQVTESVCILLQDKIIWHTMEHLMAITSKNMVQGTNNVLWLQKLSPEFTEVRTLTELYSQWWW